jgi:hypothetical protein
MAAGLKPKRAEIGRDGKIVMVFDGDDAANPGSDFDKWKVGRNGSSS